MLNFYCKHFVIDEPSNSKCLCNYFLLMLIWVNSIFSLIIHITIIIIISSFVNSYLCHSRANLKVTTYLAHCYISKAAFSSLSRNLQNFLDVINGIGGNFLQIIPTEYHISVFVFFIFIYIVL